MHMENNPSVIDLSGPEYADEPLGGHRLVNVIIVETALVGLVGLLVLGVLWEAGFFLTGLIAAAVIWVGVSPVIEIATVRKARHNVHFR